MKFLSQKVHLFGCQVFSKESTASENFNLFIPTVTLPNEVKIFWDGYSRVYIDVPGSFLGSTEVKNLSTKNHFDFLNSLFKIKGLCGTFTGNQYDDLATPDGDIENNPVEFANQ